MLFTVVLNLLPMFTDHPFPRWLLCFDSNSLLHIKCSYRRQASRQLIFSLSMFPSDSPYSLSRVFRLIAAGRCQRWVRVKNQRLDVFLSRDGRNHSFRRCMSFSHLLHKVLLFLSKKLQKHTPCFWKALTTRRKWVERN